MKRIAAIAGLTTLIIAAAGSPSQAAAPAAFGWGNNDSGKLGDGTNLSRDEPVAVSGLTGLKSIVAGRDHSLALRDDGTVWGWGSNGDSQLGNGTEESAFTPSSVARIRNAKAVSAGSYHGLALLKDGTVRAWGYNDEGQIGRDPNSTPEAALSVKVNGLNNVTAVSGGYDFSVALKKNGTVWTWGNGENGSLGDGTSDPRFTPEKVDGLSDVKAIAASTAGYHVLVLLENGRVKAWGPNEVGQLGNGSTDPSPTPITVPDLNNVKAIAAGETYSLALKENGTIRGWGSNESFQLGTEDEAMYLDPIRVTQLENIKAVAAGSSHALALKPNGTVRAWGRNFDGQLGNGTTGSAVFSPVKVSGLSGITSISAGDTHSLAAKT
jgi:alpha-tubulin suppressor-like RCC1 family protein